MMKTQIADAAEALLGPNTKLKDLKSKGVGYDPLINGNWAVAWSHYALAGDAYTAPTLDAAGALDIKGMKIGPENTVADLLTAIKQ
jgi:hypothetical protein